MRILFVCSAGVNRSRTAAEKFAEWFGHETRFRGCHASSGNKVTVDDIQWADRIVCFEEDHQFKLLAWSPHRATIMDIPDIFVYNDPVLVEHLRSLSGWLKSALALDPAPTDPTETLGECT